MLFRGKVRRARNQFISLSSPFLLFATPPKQICNCSSCAFSAPRSIEERRPTSSGPIRQTSLRSDGPSLSPARSKTFSYLTKMHSEGARAKHKEGSIKEHKCRVRRKAAKKKKSQSRPFPLPLAHQHRGRRTGLVSRLPGGKTGKSLPVFPSLYRGRPIPLFSPCFRQKQLLGVEGR